MIRDANEPVTKGGRPFWAARSLLIALGMMVLGLLMWARTPSPRSPQADSGTGGSPILESSPARQNSSEAAKPKSPALFRFGASYLGGFFFGWVCRKSIKFAMVIAGALTALVALAKHTGVIDLDWPSLQADISQSLAWLRGEEGAIKHFLTGYLPSAGACCLGIFMGARHG